MVRHSSILNLFAAGVCVAGLLFKLPSAVRAEELRTAAPPESNQRTETKAGAAPEVEIILWPGGTVAMDAQSRLQQFERYADALYPFLRIEPVVVESAMIPGLKPGSFAVAVGICPQHDVAGLVDVLRTVAPDLYTQKVPTPRLDAAPALACPVARVAAKDLTGKSVPWEFESSRRIAIGSNRLQVLAFHFSSGGQENGSSEFTGLRFLVLWMDGEGSVINSTVVERKEDTARLAAWIDRPGALGWAVQYQDPRCNRSQDRFVAWNQVSVATAQEHDIQVRDEKPVRMKEGSCGSG